MIDSLFGPSPQLTEAGSAWTQFRPWTWAWARYLRQVARTTAPDSHHSQFTSTAAPQTYRLFFYRPRREENDTNPCRGAVSPRSELLRH